MWVFKPEIATAFRDPRVLKTLPRYVNVVENRLPARFMVAKKISVNFNEKMKDDVLWKEHTKAVEAFKKTLKEIDAKRLKLEDIKKPQKNLLDLKIELCNRVLQKCCFCERRCGVDRTKGQRGFCGVGSEMRICSEFIHVGEEAPISPSHTVFFSRCNWRCVYCQNYDISQGSDYGVEISPQRLAEIVDRRRKEGSRNLNLVGGESVPYLHKIMETLQHCTANIPIILNSNAYLSVEGMKLCEGVIDVYLFDFRYFNNECAMRLSSVPKCRETLTRNHLLAAEQAEVLIRVLILPNHLTCCDKPILSWIAENLGDKVLVNVMDQYRPIFKADQYPEINRMLTLKEFKEAVEHAKKLKLIFIT